MIASLKAYIRNKETNKLIGLISDHPQVLDEKDESGSSGLLLIVYSGIRPAFTRAMELKKIFTFHEAIVCGKTDQVKASLRADSGIVNEYADDGFTPLSLAAFFDQTEIAVLLLENGADPNLHAANPSRVCALHSAVAKENHELCRLLLQHGADINATQMQNVTALHAAAHKGNLELVKLLVENGADATLVMDNGDTAMGLAEKVGHEAVRNYLKALLG